MTDRSEIRLRELEDELYLWQNKSHRQRELIAHNIATTAAKVTPCDTNTYNRIYNSLPVVVHFLFKHRTSFCLKS